MGEPTLSELQDSYWKMQRDDPVLDNLRPITETYLYDPHVEGEFKEEILSELQKARQHVQQAQKLRRAELAEFILSDE